MVEVNLSLCLFKCIFTDSLVVELRFTLLDDKSSCGVTVASCADSDNQLACLGSGKREVVLRCVLVGLTAAFQTEAVSRQCVSTRAERAGVRVNRHLAVRVCGPQ